MKPTGETGIVLVGSVAAAWTLAACRGYVGFMCHAARRHPYLFAAGNAALAVHVLAPKRRAAA